MWVMWAVGDVLWVGEGQPERREKGKCREGS